VGEVVTLSFSFFPLAIVYLWLQDSTVSSHISFFFLLVALLIMPLRLILLPPMSRFLGTADFIRSDFFLTSFDCPLTHLEPLFQRALSRVKCKNYNRLLKGVD
jgi:hypothetical protein